MQGRRSVFQIGGAPIRSRRQKAVGGLGAEPPEKIFGPGPFSFGNALLWMLKGNFMVGGPQAREEIYKSKCNSSRLAETTTQEYLTKASQVFLV